EIENVSGTVRHINILQTKLLTFDNKAIFIPNGQVSEAKIVNFSSQATRRLDLKFAIGYKVDFKKAQALIASIIETHELTLKDPEPIIRVCELTSSSVIIALKVWVNTEHYWDVNFDLLEMVKTAFDENNITIPYNQLDVNVNQVNQ
ncbi:MAG: mechanosensitive ion channel domain-containing protein, partial [Oscillospiraceae bacterium]